MGVQVAVNSTRVFRRHQVVKVKIPDQLGDFYLVPETGFEPARRAATDYRRSSGVGSLDTVQVWAGMETTEPASEPLGTHWIQVFGVGTASAAGTR